MLEYDKAEDAKNGRRLYKKDWYLRNADRMKELGFTWMQQNRVRQRQLVIDYFSEHPCTDCGEPDPTVLEFHHVRGVKKYNVGSIANGSHSDKLLFEEIAKCIVLCANCHRRRTAKVQGWYIGTTAEIPRNVGVPPILEASHPSEPSVSPSQACPSTSPLSSLEQQELNVEPLHAPEPTSEGQEFP